MTIGKDCKLTLTLEKSLMEFSGDACDQSGRLAASALSVPLGFFSMEKNRRGVVMGFFKLKTKYWLLSGPELIPKWFFKTNNGV
jgi:hypothetical protein